MTDTDEKYRRLGEVLRDVERETVARHSLSELYQDDPDEADRLVFGRRPRP